MNRKISYGISIQLCTTQQYKELPQWLSGKEPACNAGDPGSIPGLEDPLEEGMATHSSILAWIRKPGRLQSIGSQSCTQLSY